MVQAEAKLRAAGSSETSWLRIKRNEIYPRRHMFDFKEYCVQRKSHH